MSDSDQIGDLCHSGEPYQMETGEWVGKVGPVHLFAVPICFLFVIDEETQRREKGKRKRAATGTSDERTTLQKR